MKDRSPCHKLSRKIVGDHVPLDNLGLELSPTCFYLFPYHHLEVAKFESSQERDTLVLSFLKHRVRIAGRNLRELGAAFQGRTVEWIKPLPERYNAVAGEDPLVESIDVEEPTEQR